MKWLLRFIPFNSIIDYICSFLKKIWTSKTETTLDDAVIDQVLKPTLLHWKNYALDPKVSGETALLENAILIMDFINEDGLKILQIHIAEKQKELMALKREEENAV